MPRKKRLRETKKVVSTTLPSSAIEEIDDLAEERGVSRYEMLRWIIEERLREEKEAR